MFRKKCTFCNEKINKGDEIWEKVKLPEFTEKKNQPFCSKEHAESYKKYITGTPAKSSCPFCKE